MDEIEPRKSLINLLVLRHSAWFFCLFFFFFLGPHLWYMKITRLGVKSVTVASLHHSHSDSGSEPHLQSTLQLMAVLDP